jgi:ribosomal protein S18 acetylase RimI-like enzyme
MSRNRLEVDTGGNGRSDFVAAFFLIICIFQYTNTTFRPDSYLGFGAEASTVSSESHIFLPVRGFKDLIIAVDQGKTRVLTADTNGGAEDPTAGGRVIVMKKESHIVKLAAADVERIHDLWNRAGLPYRARGRDERGRLKRVIEQGIETYFGVFEDDRLIGVILASHDGRKGWLNRLAVDPLSRGRGLAQRLVRRAEDFLHEQGIEIIAVLIEPGNTASLNLFQKCGYRLFPAMNYLTKRSREDI